MKKAYVVEGTVIATVYGDLDQDKAKEYLVQMINSMDECAIGNVKIDELTEDNVQTDRYDESMFGSEMSPGEYLEKVHQVGDIRENMESLGWDLDEDFEEDMYKVMKDLGYA